ncbi:MAG: hypothetical protein C4523_05450 [Myxococcales bacterium]|nr:MAG: hypothetical protein C4523_05450 [Myxococcales bacterium]
MSAKDSLALLKGLAADPAGKREFERLMAIERALCGIPPTDPPWTHFDTERIGKIVLHRVGAAAEKEFSWSAWGWRLAFAIPIILVLLAAPLLYRLSGQQGSSIPKSLFAPRGSEEPYETHLFLFCIEGKGRAAKVTRLDRPPFLTEAPEKCSINSEFQLALTNLTTKKKYIYVVGMDDAGRRLWYFPEPGEGESRPAPTGVAEKLFGESIRLSVNHRLGLMRMFVVFSEHPVTEDEISRALDAARARQDVLSLPLERNDVYQQGFEAQLTE